MKNLARCLGILLVISVTSTLHAQEWIPYVPSPIIEQPRVSYFSQPVYRPSNPTIIYQYVPYTVQQNIVVENQRWFCRTQIIVSRPVVQWVYQPVVFYP